ncbi:hypothetical protein VitviT2T_009253 [Vitis vinifera]|uniref:JmjC domain-containing protein n=2 Tax=Vitis vinifera TaxID=29760 RepID=A0ABY9C4Y7_VITVI|nr:lysine-specific demethylase JMJ31 [Vitis vinifera]WJZ90079.1 hypothetical protein VitviT2T_009253 [Vitis vinifera]|eukprot:XP_010646130.1 PREDICTED: uncharacterized protein LOC100247818 [Vitis vinifera]
MEGSLQIPAFNLLPSSLDFASVESRNVPAVFIGCIKNWRAFSNWNPSNGGLDYLQERVGSSTVEAMLSRSAPVFYGDLRSHERVPLPFSDFIGFCKQRLQDKDVGGRVCFESERHGLAGSDAEQSNSLLGDAPQQIYLAQVPIMNVENDDKVQLATLIEDIQTPAFLETKTLASINLWMNSAQARSSTHYDPHHNLLCIIAGCKQVVLWPPSASPLLYPMPIYGEASNHSSVALEDPDFSIHPRAEHSMKHSQKVILHAGDALFIPEGWFHQVDSNDLTIAVNFWWRSNITSSLSEHMDAYYLRRILRRLTDKEMNQLLGENSAGMEKMEKHSCELPNNGESDNHESDLDQTCASKDLKGSKLKQRIMLHEVEPLALQALHKLVALVHDSVKVADRTEPVHSTSGNDSDVKVKSEQKRIVASDLFHLEDDPLAKILWTLEPLTLQNVFLAMVHNFPRTLEALILYLLSPVGAEVLTRKFEEMDQHITEEERNEFYQLFYGVFDDQFAAMKAILNGKESFALQAFKNVLDQYLGVNYDGPKPLVG